MTINRADSDVDDSGILSMYARDDEDDLIHSPSATPIFLPPEVTRTPPRGEPWYHQLRVGQPAGPFAAPTAASPARSVTAAGGPKVVIYVDTRSTSQVKVGHVRCRFIQNLGR